MILHVYANCFFPESTNKTKMDFHRPKDVVIFWIIDFV